MSLLCLFGHRWQLRPDGWVDWIDVVLPLRNFSAVLRCRRCGTRRLFESRPR